MERVTFPAEAVQQVLGQHYKRKLLDLKKHEAEAAVVKPEAIPVSIVFDASGREIDRKVGFVPPAEFATWLRECLAK
jgi:hypothetical protein